LTLRRASDADAILLAPGGASELRGRGLTLRLQQDATGKVTGFTVDAGRVRGIVFVRN
jgi:hypothetical protein